MPNPLAAAAVTPWITKAGHALAGTVASGIASGVSGGISNRISAAIGGMPPTGAGASLVGTNAGHAASMAQLQAGLEDNELSRRDSWDARADSYHFQAEQNRLNRENALAIARIQANAQHANLALNNARFLYDVNNQERMGNYGFIDRIGTSLMGRRDYESFINAVRRKYGIHRDNAIDWAKSFPRF